MNRPFPTLAAAFAATLALALFPPSADAAWKVARSEELSAGPPKIVRTTASGGGREVRLHAALFSTRTHTLKVVDDAAGGDSLGKAMGRAGCVAGVNGGYFHPDRTPLGLVVSGGKRIHPAEKAKLLSGMLAVEKGEVRLLRSREVSAKARPDEALQAGPFLVDRSAPVAGLNAAKRDERTVVATDGKGKVALIATGPLTLAEAAALLATPEMFPGFRISRALNLDGGSSTAFWSAAAGVDLRAWKPVRNYIGIAEK